MSSPAPIWSKFVGQTNSPEVIREKARMLGYLLLNLTPQAVNGLFEGGKRLELSLSKEKEGEIQFKWLLLFLYITDWTASDYIPNERALFMDTILSLVREILSGVYEHPEDAREFREQFSDMYNVSQIEKAKYKKIFDVQPGGTLIWESAKETARLAGTDADIFSVQLIVGITNSTLITLGLRELFTGKEN